MGGGKIGILFNGDKLEVITMRFFEELTYPEIAQKMNKSEGAVRLIVFRALKDIERLLREQLA